MKKKKQRLKGQTTRDYVLKPAPRWIEHGRLMVLQLQTLQRVLQAPRSAQRSLGQESHLQKTRATKMRLSSRLRAKH